MLHLTGLAVRYSIPMTLWAGGNRGIGYGWCTGPPMPTGPAIESDNLSHGNNLQWKYHRKIFSKMGSWTNF